MRVGRHVNVKTAARARVDMDSISDACGLNIDGGGLKASLQFETAAVLCEAVLCRLNQLQNMHHCRVVFAYKNVTMMSTPPIIIPRNFVFASTICNQLAAGCARFGCARFGCAWSANAASTTRAVFMPLRLHRLYGICICWLSYGLFLGLELGHVVR